MALLAYLLVLIVAVVVPFVASVCVPDVPQKLLADPAVLQHPAVTSALETIEQSLSELFISTTRDGLSFAIVRSHRQVSRTAWDTRFTIRR